MAMIAEKIINIISKLSKTNPLVFDYTMASNNIAAGATVLHNFDGESKRLTFMRTFIEREPTALIAFAQKYGEAHNLTKSLHSMWRANAAIMQQCINAHMEKDE